MYVTLSSALLITIVELPSGVSVYGAFGIPPIWNVGR
jgi:hypothetical protein